MHLTVRQAGRWVALLIYWVILSSITERAAASSPLTVRILTTDFTPAAKFERLRGWARMHDVRLDVVRAGDRSADSVVRGVDLLILDTPRGNDLTQLQAWLGDRLSQASTPWIRVGGGPPEHGHLSTSRAQTLIGYYANGGETNHRRLFAWLDATRSGDAGEAIARPLALGESGIYHPDAPAPFTDLGAYLGWGHERWAADAPRVAFAIPRGNLVDDQLAVVDAMIHAAEAHGQRPLAFWFDAAEPDALQKLLVPAGTEALVNLQHMQNGEARRAEFLTLGIPVIQALGYREGDTAQWRAGTDGVPVHAVPVMLDVPESQGMSDPLVISATGADGAEPIPAQLDALIMKLESLVRLRRLPAEDKRIALLFWNHPDGAENIAASNLNVPRSLERLITSLGDHGYRAEARDEEALINAMQRMLGGFYHPTTLDALHADGLAMALPLSDYRRWFDTLPSSAREAIVERWGEPEEHWALREGEHDARFLLPALALDHLLLMPQPPRAGRPGEAYHDLYSPPDHLYLAAYLYLRQRFAADALVHFGTHGTQEWLPGKSRGLAIDDLALLPLGNLPVIYPYIQDNVGEALQARRRGRAVTISHQTPPFSPGGLHDELSELHAAIHQYQQLDQGGVRQRTAERILSLAEQGGMLADLGLDQRTAQDDFDAFVAGLHDHLHALSATLVPLGLHVFGEPANPERRLVTVMQQLGDDYPRALGLDPGETLPSELDALEHSGAWRLLHRHLREGAALDQLADPELRTLLERAQAFDAHLAETGETEALLTALDGGFVAPGPGGDPVRNPEVPSGRNLYGFEADKLPSRDAFDAGQAALGQLIERYRDEHDGQVPTKLAFSLWSSEAMRHLGVVESELLHALGLRPVWDAGGRVRSLEIVPREQLGRPRIDVVVQITGVYRDQFDGFMRLLAEAIDRLAVLDEADSPIIANNRTTVSRLVAQDVPAAEAERLARVRLFGNAPGDYGSGVSALAQDSTAWEGDGALAEQYLTRLGHGYGAKGAIAMPAGSGLFAAQLSGVQAALMARSSQLHGMLSTDHPFEFLGGMAAAIRHLDGDSPALYVADLRQRAPSLTGADAFIATEMRARYLNPRWIGAMQQEGYAGTLEILDAVDNLWGWQATAPSTVRADQWQAVHDTFVRDQRELGLDAWFERHNPSAQARLIERLAEAIRKGYWDADQRTRQELSERWQTLAQEGAGEDTAAAIRAALNSGFGLDATASGEGGSPGETISGQLLEQVTPSAEAAPAPLVLYLGLALLCLALAAGGWHQSLANRSG